MTSRTKRPEGAIADVADGETTHYICQEGYELTERDFDGVTGPPELVGSAKEGTPGAYVLLGDKRAFYCLNEGNILQDFEYTDEWEPGQLLTSGLLAAPNTHIAATRTKQDGIQVFYQGPSGEIQSISTAGGGGWQPSRGLPSTRPLGGASLYAIYVKDVIRMFYAHQDNSIHELVFSGGTWRDAEVPLSDSGSRKCDIFAIVENDEYSLEFTDAERRVFVIEDEKLTQIGRITENGEFRKPNDAEGGPRGPSRRRR